MNVVPLRPIEGEVPECVRCEHLVADVEAKESLLGIKQSKLDAAWREIARLQKDREREHAEHPDRELVERLHASWQQKTGHPNSGLDMGDGSRFEAYLRGLKLAKKAAKKLKLDLDPEALCERALDGAAFDPYTRQSRNGNVERYDDPTTIFKNAASFERFVNRAPRRAA